MLADTISVVLVAFYSLLLAFGLLLNASILQVVLCSRTNRRKISNLFLAFFLITAVCSCLFNATYNLVILCVPLPRADSLSKVKYAGECKAAMFFVYMLSVLKLLSLVLLSFDRFFALRWPYQYAKHARKRIPFTTACLAVVQSIVTVFPATLQPGWITYEGSVGAACSFGWAVASPYYIVPVIALDFIVPALVLLITNVKVFLMARRQRKKMESELHRVAKKRQVGLQLARTLLKSVTLMETESGVDLSPCSTSNSFVASNEMGAQAALKESNLHILECSEEILNGKVVNMNDSFSRSEVEQTCQKWEELDFTTLKREGKVEIDGSDTGIGSTRIVRLPSEDEVGGDASKFRRHSRRDRSMSNVKLDNSKEIKGMCSNFPDSKRSNSVHCAKGTEATEVSNCATEGLQERIRSDTSFDMAEKDGESPGIADIHHSRFASSDSEVFVNDDVALECSTRSRASVVDNRECWGCAEHRSASILSVDEQDEFVFLTREKRLRLLSIPSIQFSSADLEAELGESKWNTALSTLSLVAFFFVTWLPFIISRLIATFSSAGFLSNETVTVTSALNSFDVVINPIIILSTRKNFRRELIVNLKSKLPVSKRQRSN